jgi:CIC family chloride channel protein
VWIPAFAGMTVRRVASNRGQVHSHRPDGADTNRAWGSPMGDLKNRLFSVLGDLTGPQLRAFWAAKHPLVWLLAVAIGVVAAFAILGFRLKAIGQIQWLWLGNSNENVVATLAALREPWVVVAAPAVGGLIVGLILWKVMRTRRAHGIADVIEAGALHSMRRFRCAPD